MNYTQTLDKDGKLVCIFEPTIGAIPLDPANTDYQRYLRWLEDPNADEFQPPLS